MILRKPLHLLKVSVGEPVSTPNDGEIEIPEHKWLHVATEGEFDGHADGSFKLDRAVFQSFIRNFRADPRYVAGEDGIGSAQVIPFDFEHASEMDATSGTIPAAGAPAPGWVLDLDIRNGPGGEAQLWAFAKLGKKIREYIANDEYRHVSIAFALDGTDPTSGKSIGGKLSSIAFTNHPFLRNLTPMQIAASNRGAARLLFSKPIALNGGKTTSAQRVPEHASGDPLAAADAEFMDRLRKDPLGTAMLVWTGQLRPPRAVQRQSTPRLTEREAPRAATVSLKEGTTMKITLAQIKERYPDAANATMACLQFIQDTSPTRLSHNDAFKKACALRAELEGPSSSTPLPGARPAHLRQPRRGVLFGEGAKLSPDPSKPLDLRGLQGSLIERAQQALEKEAGPEAWSKLSPEQRIGEASAALATRPVLDDEAEVDEHGDPLPSPSLASASRSSTHLGGRTSSEAGGLTALRVYPGRNDVERAMVHLSEAHPSFERFPFDERIKRAGELVRELRAGRSLDAR